MKYEEISYDVWGNEKDGFDLNAAFTTGNFIEIPEKSLFDKKFLIKNLKKQGLIRKGLHISSVGIDISDNIIYISDNRNGRPAFELRKIKEE